MSTTLVSAPVSATDSTPDNVRQFYVDVIERLTTADVPFLVGGAYAFASYVHIEKATKDLDLFLRASDIPSVLALLARAGYRTDLTFRHWLAKVHCGDAFIDLIFSSGNAVATVDDEWFEHARSRELFGIQVPLSPPEEMLWSKAFVQERERFDGADVMHLIRHFGPTLDWLRLLRRFGAHWRVLLGHLVMFGFVYPNQRDLVPSWVMAELLRRLASEHTEVNNTRCYGTLLSREQYLHDIGEIGYHDARLAPAGTMDQPTIDAWTAAIHERDTSHT